mgnify:CR=1 FL=1
MSSSIKNLAGQTVVYGATTMLGRLLNWLLMPFYIRTLTTLEYGVIVNVYGVISLLQVIFTYGLETGYFRFGSKENSSVVLKTTVNMLLFTSILLVVLSFAFATPLNNLLYDGNYKEAVILMGIIVAVDSFISIPFANLRLQNRAYKFGVIKLVSIFLNIFFNLFFLLFIPWTIKNGYLNDSLVSLYSLGNGVFYVLFSNLISSAAILVFFITDLKLKSKFDSQLCKQLLKYSWPVLLVGITGMITQNSDKILMPKLIKNNGLESLAIYGANFKIGVLMSLFTQSFRFAFEPFFFNNKGKGVVSYAKVMDYFIFFGLLIFLGVTLFIDVINILLTPEYIHGNIIIPSVLLGQLFYGIYFNLSLWYKLTDKTIYGAFFGIIGTIITLALNFILIPKYGIIGGSLAMLSGYFVMMILSYFIGKKFYFVPYPVLRIMFYFFIAVILYYINSYFSSDIIILNYLYKIVLISSYILIFYILQKKFPINYDKYQSNK